METTTMARDPVYTQYHNWTIILLSGHPDWYPSFREPSTLVKEYRVVHIFFFILPILPRMLGDPLSLSVRIRNRQRPYHVRPRLQLRHAAGGLVGLPALWGLGFRGLRV